MRILILGHTGFLGDRFLDFLDENHENIHIVGISDSVTGKTFNNIDLTEYRGFEYAVETSGDFDLVFNFVHSQNSRDVIKSEKELADKISNFILEKNINAPVIMLRSVGKDSDHIRSRISFDEILKDKLNNEIFEIRASIIEEEGSVSYEIPYRILKRTKFIPRFPWMSNNVSLIKLGDLLSIFNNILTGNEKRNLITPKHRTMTYEDYIKEIAYEKGFPLEFIDVPFNDFTISPLLVKLLTGLDYNIVKNLMRTLKNDSVL